MPMVATPKLISLHRAFAGLQRQLSLWAQAFLAVLHGSKSVGPIEGTVLWHHLLHKAREPHSTRCLKHRSQIKSDQKDQNQRRVACLLSLSILQRHSGQFLDSQPWTMDHAHGCDPATDHSALDHWKDEKAESPTI